MLDLLQFRALRKPVGVWVKSLYKGMCFFLIAAWILILEQKLKRRFRIQYSFLSGSWAKALAGCTGGSRSVFLLESRRKLAVNSFVFIAQWRANHKNMHMFFCPVDLSTKLSFSRYFSILTFFFCCFNLSWLLACCGLFKFQKLKLKYFALVVSITLSWQGHGTNIVQGIQYKTEGQGCCDSWWASRREKY